MSSLSQDLPISANDFINNNLLKLKKKINYIKSNIEDDDDNIYDQLYCKINIYFTSILDKVRLKYLAAIDKYKNIIKQYEKDILKLMMDNMLLKIEINSLKEKNESKKKKKNLSKIKNIFPNINNNNHINNNYNMDTTDNRTNLRNQFYRSQENINNIKNKSVDFFIKYNNNIGINNNKKDKLNKRNLTSINNKLKKCNKNVIKNININKNGNISNKSSNSNFNFLIKKGNNSVISDNVIFPLSCKKNKKSFRLDEIEKNIKKHKSTLTLCNIRKIKDEMETIINKNKYNNKKNKFYIINEDSVEINENYLIDENTRQTINNNKIKNINNNMSNNIIHNTSINIFNPSKGLYPLNVINYNVKHENNKIYKTKVDDNSNNNIITSLKNVYSNLKSKKKIFNNTKLNKNNNNNNYNIKTEENIKKVKRINKKLNMFNSRTYTSDNIITPNDNNYKKENSNDKVIHNKLKENLDDNQQSFMYSNNQKDSYNFKFTNFPLNNKNNNLMSRNNNNSFYNNSLTYLNNYVNTEYKKGETDENISNHNNNNLSNNIIPIHRKNNFIQRNKSFNCLLKLKKIIDNKNIHKKVKKSQNIKLKK